MTDPSSPTPIATQDFSTLRLERLSAFDVTPAGPTAPVAVDETIAVLTLDRPDRLNALDPVLIEELHAALDVVAAEPELRALILTGEGRGFCSGLDLTDIGISGSGNATGRGRVQRGMDLQQRIADFVPALRSLRIPVVAAVNGAASGGGLALALASDVRIASRTARFNVAFVRIGLSGCDIGVSWLLPRWIGASRAFELLLTGRMVESDEAERIGLVSRVVEDDELLSEAAHTARLIATNSPTGVWMTKEVMWSNLEVASMRAGIDLENRTQIMTSFTEDTAEAVGAFFERRPPEFRNR
jgi:enoyl-CoA hydratase